MLQPSQQARLGRALAVLASLGVGLALWAIAVRGLDEAVAAGPAPTLRRLVELIVSGELPRAAASSLTLFAAGLALATITAVPAGLLLARSNFARHAFGDWILLLYAMPTVALIPFILSIFGIGFAAKLLVVFLFAFFPVLYNTLEGARTIRPDLFEVARSFRSGEVAIWAELLLPGSLPFVMTGIRQAIGRALVGVIAAEIFLTASGLGELMMLAARDYDTPALFATILMIAMLGAGLSFVGSQVEQIFAPWRGPRA